MTHKDSFKAGEKINFLENDIHFLSKGSGGEYNPFDNSWVQVKIPEITTGDAQARTLMSNKEMDIIELWGERNFRMRSHYHKFHIESLYVAYGVIQIVNEGNASTLYSMDYAKINPDDEHSLYFKIESRAIFIFKKLKGFEDHIFTDIYKARL